MQQNIQHFFFNLFKTHITMRNLLPAFGHCFHLFRRSRNCGSLLAHNSSKPLRFDTLPRTSTKHSNCSGAVTSNTDTSFVKHCDTTSSLTCFTTSHLAFYRINPNNKLSINFRKKKIDQK